MGNFRRDSGGGRDRGGSGGRFFGGRSGFGRGNDRGGSRNDSPREMFKTVCSNCGKDCEVPFRPTTGKPVYCSDCFETMGGRSDRPDRSDKQSLPFQGRPRFDGPRRDDRSQTASVDYSKQFNELSVKLDKIIALLTPKIDVVEEVTIEKPKKSVKKKSKVTE